MVLGALLRGPAGAGAAGAPAARRASAGAAAQRRARPRHASRDGAGLHERRAARRATTWRRSISTPGCAIERPSTWPTSSSSSSTAACPPRLDELSDRPEGSLANPLKPDQDIVGTITTADGPLDLVLERVNRGAPGAGLAVLTQDARRHPGRLRRSRSRVGRSVSADVPDQAPHRRHPPVRVAGARADRSRSAIA